MNIKITKRDVSFFLWGILAVILIDLVVYWDSNVQAMKDGYNAAGENARKIESNK